MSPLIRGGNRQVGLIVILGLSLLLLAVVAADWISSYLKQGEGDLVKSDLSNRFNPAWRRFLLFVLLSSPVWLGLLYLIPLPVDIWRSMAGRDFYFSTLEAMKFQPPTSFTLSLTPDATWASVLAGVPVVVTFAIALVLPEKAVKLILKLLLVVAVIQVLLSVFQLALGTDSFFYFGLAATREVVGSFANRNHLANLLVMCLPVCIFVLYDQSKSKRSKRPNSSNGSSKQIKLIFLLFIGFAFLLILLATLSRGGLISGFIALSMSTCMYLLTLGDKVSRKQSILYFGTAIAFVGFAMLANGLEGIQSRLGARLLSDAEVRNTISNAALTAASNFWPWGSGLGSFEAVFPRFQPALNLGSSAYIEYAHNDYAQIVMELGLSGVLLLCVFVILLLERLFSFIRIYRAEPQLPQSVVMQCFCGISLIAFLLHCWVEFNMHIPALAITAAFLGGVFLRTPSVQTVKLN